MTKLSAFLLIVYTISFCGHSCTGQKDLTEFDQDLKILKEISKIQVLENESAKLIVSGELQGRAFSGTMKGLNGRNIFYYNKKVAQSENAKYKLSKLAGADRMIFGPEVGDYAIFFAPGTAQNANTICVSPALDTSHFMVTEANKRYVESSGSMTIRNAFGTVFPIHVKRKIELLNDFSINHELAIEIPQNVSRLAFMSDSYVKNTGDIAWNKSTGLLSIWNLSCFQTTPATKIIIPIRGKIDTVSNYFTPLSNDRIEYRSNAVIYKADAAYMNKIGIQPENCKNVFGSYSPEINQLAIVKYLLKRDSVYVNSQWGHSEAYKGDVINIFNGEVNPTKDRNWPFYEMETSSPSWEISPGREIYHTHLVFVFVGDFDSLNQISKHVLGVGLDDMR